MNTEVHQDPGVISAELLPASMDTNGPARLILQNFVVFIVQKSQKNQ